MLVGVLVPLSVWRMLLEMFSRASVIMSKHSSAMSDDAFEQMSLVVKSISSILTSVLVMSPPSRFAIMELIVQMDIEEHWSIPKSIMQHALSDVPRKVGIDTGIRELFAQQLIDSTGSMGGSVGYPQSHGKDPKKLNSTQVTIEIVLEASWSCLGSSVGSSEEQQQHRQQQQEQTTLFVVTNKRVALFQRNQPFTHEELHQDHSIGNNSSSSSSSSNHNKGHTQHQNRWVLLKEMSLLHVERLVLGLTGQRIHMAQKTYRKNDVVVITTPTMQVPRVGTIVTENTSNGLYVVNVNLVKPLLCPCCTVQTATLKEMELHRLRAHYQPHNYNLTKGTNGTNGTTKQEVEQTCGAPWEMNDQCPLVNMSDSDDYVEVSVKQSQVDLLDETLEGEMDLVVVSFPNTTITTRIVESIRMSIETATKEEFRIERDVTTAMSIRKLMWEVKQQPKDAHRHGKESSTKTTKKKPKKGQTAQEPKTKQQLEQDRVAHRNKNNNHVSINTKPLSSSLWSRLLPRHLDPEPTVTVVRTYSPDEEGIFLGLRVLVFCENYFFLCHENLTTWELPTYWRTDAKEGQMDRDEMKSNEVEQTKIDIEKDKNSLSKHVDRTLKNREYRSKMNGLKQKFKNYNQWHELNIKNKREEYNAAAIQVLEGVVSHHMLNVVEYAPSVDSEIPGNTSTSTEDRAFLFCLCCLLTTPFFFIFFFSSHVSGIRTH